MSSNLCVHVDAKRIGVEELEALPAPVSLGRRHCPVPHSAIVEILRDKVAGAGLAIRKEDHAVTKGAAAYFGVFDLAGPGEWAVSLGLRNDHKRRMSAAMCYGQRVFVCDNLAFCGENKVFRRHTGGIVRDLENEIGEALKQVGPMHEQMERRVAAYSGRELVAPEMARLCRELVEQAAIPEKAWPKILLEWARYAYWGRTPDGARPMGDPSAWGFYNAITQVVTPRERPVLPGYAEKTAAFTEVFDKFVELS